MRIELVEIQNFRKLKSICIDFTAKTTLLVGPNNSGKTSAIAALTCFLVDPSMFSTNDFTLSNWNTINKIGAEWETLADQLGGPSPTLNDWEGVLPSLDLWLEVGVDEVHYVVELLPSINWNGGILGVRLRLEPKNVEDLFKEYISAVRAAKAAVKGSKSPALKLWPATMRDFLDRRLGAVFTLRGYALDPTQLRKPENGRASPQRLPSGGDPIGGNPLDGLIRINVIYAHREFSDAYSSGLGLDHDEHRGTGRLSSQLRSYYDKHLNPTDSPGPSDLEALLAIPQAEKIFNVKLRTVFLAALEEVETLGYPGVTDPKITIATKIRLVDGLDHKAAVQYDVVPDDGTGTAGPLRLPEDCNGLGYQNLISIVFRLMSFRDGWMRVGKAANVAPGAMDKSYFPPPLHLILIEEPEVHLHAQVQQVFIRKAYDLLRNHPNLGTNSKLATQLVVSTHSSHVAHECEFSCLRYFRRHSPVAIGDVPITTVVNLSEVFGNVPDTQRFVTRYLKATHCDLFFADAAIFVEGPAERILVPNFVSRDFPKLNQCYLTILEIGGSHAHRLRGLIEHLGLVTLIITDLDAADPASDAAVPPARGSGQVTRNATLKTWLPEIEQLDQLLDASENQRVKKYDDFFSIRVAYQTPVEVNLDEKPSKIEALPNTFEDALVYDNLQVFRNLEIDGAVKKIRSAIEKNNTGAGLGKQMFEILKNAKKAEMAMDLLALEQEPWPLATPTYIREGLSWLDQHMQRKQQEQLLLAQPTVPNLAVEG